jgi:hypothetical protein
MFCKFVMTMLIIAFAVAAFGQELSITDPAQLIGKKVIVLRGIPLCQPGTYNALIAYTGKQATVVSVKPGKHYKFDQAMLSRMPEQTRDILIDQQKAATVLFQFEDGKKLDTCAPMGPKALSDGLELVPGETLASAPDPAPTPVAASASLPKWQAATPGMLSDAEVKAALAGEGKDHWIRINDAGFMAAQGASLTLPHVILLLPEAMIAARAETAKRQFLTYEPTEEDRRRSLTVFAQGYIGKTYQEGCESITRVVLVSSEAGGVVEEAYVSEDGTEAWGNAFGATNYCQWLRTKFSMDHVRRVRSAAKDGEFFIAVFAGSAKTKTYKIKHKHQDRLGWK